MVRHNKQDMIFKSLLVFAAFGLPFLSTGQVKSIYNIDKAGVAMQGYDPVSYFEADKPLKGSKSYLSIYLGQKFLFANEAHLKKFEIDPAKYNPAYGGWCAYAMGIDGAHVKIDPETYKIINSRLYLFYNFFFVNTLTKWDEDEPKLKQTADGFWQKETNK